MRHILELHNDFRVLRLQSFARTDIERHARPAPVLDFNFECHESLGRAFRATQLLVIAADSLTVYRAARVAPADGIDTDVLRARSVSAIAAP